MTAEFEVNLRLDSDSDNDKYCGLGLQAEMADSSAAPRTHPRCDELEMFDSILRYN